MPLAFNDNDGVLTIDGISMNPTNGAWMIQGDKTGNGGLLQLWIEFAIRGEDRVLPGAPGVIPYQRRMTVSPHQLALTVVGDTIGETGAAEFDQRVGLQTNLLYLRENVFLPVNTQAGTRAAILDTPDGTQLCADIHVLHVSTQQYHLHECGSIWIGTMHISIPAGSFEECGSS